MVHGLPPGTGRSGETKCGPLEYQEGKRELDFDVTAQPPLGARGGGGDLRKKGDDGSREKRRGLREAEASPSLSARSSSPVSSLQESLTWGPPALLDLRKLSKWTSLGCQSLSAGGPRHMGPVLLRSVWQGLV